MKKLLLLPFLFIACKGEQKTECSWSCIDVNGVQTPTVTTFWTGTPETWCEWVNDPDFGCEDNIKCECE